MQQWVPALPYYPLRGPCLKTPALNSPLITYKLFFFRDKHSQNKLHSFQISMRETEKETERVKKNECVCFRGLFFHRH